MTAKQSSKTSLDIFLSTKKHHVYSILVTTRKQTNSLNPRFEIMGNICPAKKPISEEPCVIIIVTNGVLPSKALPRLSVLMNVLRSCVNRVAVWRLMPKKDERHEANEQPTSLVDYSKLLLKLVRHIWQQAKLMQYREVIIILQWHKVKVWEPWAMPSLRTM